MVIEGTDYVEPLEIKTRNTSFVNDEAYGTWDELYHNDTKAIVELSGKVITRNFIVRDQGVFSYQQEKLLNEVKKYWIEKGQNFPLDKAIFEEGRYEFTEEYSGLHLVVLARKAEGKGGHSTYAFSLFTLENIHDAFQILNEYYYYIFIFQLVLVLVLVYFLFKVDYKSLNKAY